MNERKLVEYCRNNRLHAKDVLSYLVLELSSQKTRVQIRDEKIKGRIAKSHNVLRNKSVIKSSFIPSSDLERIVGIMRRNIA